MFEVRYRCSRSPQQGGGQGGRQEPIVHTLPPLPYLECDSTDGRAQELKRLDDDANVFKAVGPVLVKQDLMEARSNVSNRLDYIKKDIDRLDAQIKTTESRLLEGEKEVRWLLRHAGTRTGRLGGAGHTRGRLLARCPCPLPHCCH